jgi:selenocysteine lyase/cysteine desulfurase
MSQQQLSLAVFRDQFPSLARLAWFDTPAVAPAARPVIDALRRAVDDWEDGRLSWRDWEENAPATRSLFAQIVGGDAENVALMSSVAEAAATVARSLPRGRIVVGENEFRSNLFPWLALRQRGFEIDAIADVRGLMRTDDVIAAIKPDTVLVAVSELVSRNGSRLDLARIADACRPVGARLFVDATQSLGVLRLPAGHRFDFVACHGYKWLLCPRGCAWLFVRKDRLDELMPLAPSWRSTTDARLFGGPMEFQATAQKLDTSFSWLPWAGARAALELLLSVDAIALERHVLRLADGFKVEAERLGWHTLAVEQVSQIVVVPCASAPVVASRLRGANVAASAVGDAVRFGIHGFNNEQDIDAALRVLAESA